MGNKVEFECESMRLKSNVWLHVLEQIVFKNIINVPKYINRI